MPKKTEKNLKNWPWVGGIQGRVENMRSGWGALILSTKHQAPGTMGNESIGKGKASQLHHTRRRAKRGGGYVCK